MAESSESEDLSEQGRMFHNRLKKNMRRLKPYWKRYETEALRVYDHDIPELPWLVDLYRCEDGSQHLVMAYLAGRYPHEAAWIKEMQEVAGRALQVEARYLHLKTRERQEGLAQYDKLLTKDTRARRHKLREGGLSFWLDFESYLDTGLFLDHRLTRRMVKEESQGKDVLNLFAYTGSFSCYAAKGGAHSTTTVDMSRTYCDWADENLSLNGYHDRERHRIIQTDVLSWLESTNERFHLAVLDPPTFSNSKRMEDAFEIGKDHVKLILALSERLHQGGVLYFSTNFRRFKLDEHALKPAFSRMEEKSRESVPFDFRNKKIHRLWRFER